MFTPKGYQILTSTLALVLPVPGEDEGDADIVESHQVITDEQVGEEIGGKGEEPKMKQVAQLVNTKIDLPFKLSEETSQASSLICK